MDVYTCLASCRCTLAYQQVPWRQLWAGIADALAVLQAVGLITVLPPQQVWLLCLASFVRLSLFAHVVCCATTFRCMWRIHRHMADWRFLAIPASCRRVAAYNPNWYTRRVRGGAGRPDHDDDTLPSSCALLALPPDWLSLSACLLSLFCRTGGSRHGAPACGSPASRPSGRAAAGSADSAPSTPPPTTTTTTTACHHRRRRRSLACVPTTTV
jgi:hypothetical protein